MMESVLIGVENNLGRGKKCCLPAFTTSSKMISKGILPQSW